MFLGESTKKAQTITSQHSNILNKLIQMSWIKTLFTAVEIGVTNWLKSIYNIHLIWIPKRLTQNPRLKTLYHYLHIKNKSNSLCFTMRCKKNKENWPVIWDCWTQVYNPPLYTNFCVCVHTQNEMKWIENLKYVKALFLLRDPFRLEPDWIFIFEIE